MGTRGFSAPGLAAMHDVMATHVASGSMPGLVCLVARHDDVDAQAIGTRAFGDAEPIGRDAIFRIASLRRLGTLPLMAQPGKRWLHNTGLQVLGVFVERASGKSLEAFLRERLFHPLHMPDTGFTVSAAQRPRFTTAYRPDPESGEIAVADSVENSFWNQPIPFPNAAGWLLSTIDDYWAFVQMILNRGVHQGERLLAESSVGFMTTDHLTAEQRAASQLFLGNDGGWGAGTLAPAAGLDGAHTHRVFGWDGGSGTTWRSDIDAGLTGILMTQREMTSPQPPAAFTDFWDCTYRALD